MKLEEKKNKLRTIKKTKTKKNPHRLKTISLIILWENFPKYLSQV